MLETVKGTIHNIPDISFNAFYTQYMMKMQDKIIDLEIAFVENNNVLTPMKFDRLISDSFRKLVDDNDRNKRNKKQI